MATAALHNGPGCPTIVCKKLKEAAYDLVRD
jgi:hypothetical protein